MEKNTLIQCLKHLSLDEISDALNLLQDTTIPEEMKVVFSISGRYSSLVSLIEKKVIDIEKAMTEKNQIRESLFEFIYENYPDLAHEIAQLRTEIRLIHKEIIDINSIHDLLNLHSRLPDDFCEEMLKRGFRQAPIKPSDHIDTIIEQVRFKNNQDEIVGRAYNEDFKWITSLMTPDQAKFMIFRSEIKALGFSVVFNDTECVFYRKDHILIKVMMKRFNPLPTIFHAFSIENI